MKDKKKNTQSQNAEESLKQKSFGELRKFIDACLKDTSQLDDKDRQLATTNRDKLLEYARLLELKIPTEPAITIPPFIRWQRPTSLGTDSPLVLPNIVKQFEQLEKDRYQSYLKDKQQYVAIASDMITAIKTQHAIVARIVKDIERYHKQPAAFFAQKLNWKLLPSGTDSFSKIVNYYELLAKRNTHLKYDVDRLYKVYSLHPNDIYIGTDEFEGYVIFYFRQIPVAVLECPITGNAIYLFNRDWASLSRLSKSELLNNYSDVIVRIVHNGEWFLKLKSFILRQLKLATMTATVQSSTFKQDDPKTFTVTKLKRK